MCANYLLEQMLSLTAGRRRIVPADTATTSSILKLCTTIQQLLDFTLSEMAMFPAQCARCGNGGLLGALCVGQTYSYTAAAAVRGSMANRDTRWGAPNGAIIPPTIGSALGSWEVHAGRLAEKEPGV